MGGRGRVPQDPFYKTSCHPVVPRIAELPLHAPLSLRSAVAPPRPLGPTHTHCVPAGGWATWACCCWTWPSACWCWSALSAAPRAFWLGESVGLRGRVGEGRGEAPTAPSSESVLPSPSPSVGLATGLAEGGAPHGRAPLWPSSCALGLCPRGAHICLGYPGFLLGFSPLSLHAVTQRHLKTCAGQLVMGTPEGQARGSVLGLEAVWVQILALRLTQLATLGKWPTDAGTPSPHLKDEDGDSSSVG